MSVDSVSHRYDRQTIIEGWNQNTINDAKVAIIGTSALANYVGITLAAFGFGNVEVYGNGKISREMMSNHASRRGQADYGKGFLFFDGAEGDFAAVALSDFLNKINPLGKHSGIGINPSYQRNAQVLGRPQLIIDCTNDAFGKYQGMLYAKRSGIPFISASCNAYAGGLGILFPNTSDTTLEKYMSNYAFPEFNGSPQGTTVAQVIGGLAAEEARKCIMPFAREKKLDDLVFYNLQSHKRFDRSVDVQIANAMNLSDKSICMVGAGALGNFVGLDAVLSGASQVYILDFDTVENTNLNRQVFYYDAVGRKKASSLAKKLMAINPRCKVDALDMKVLPSSEDFFKDTKIDVLMDTVDNNKTRALLNYFAIKYGIPFISGGTRYNSGQSVVYVPGKTACLNCQSDIDTMALTAHRPTQSCIYAPEPSVITSNEIVGGLMGGELKKVLHSEEYGDVAQGVLKYVSEEQFRLALLPTAPVCDCHTDQTKQKKWIKKMEKLYEV